MKHKNLVIVGYARSGVTVLNRCLAGDNRLICLSEINTRVMCPTQPNKPHEQVKDWYGLNIKVGSILDEIDEILNHSSNKGRPIVLRDWSFGSFVKFRHNNFEPTGTLNTIDDIKNRFPDQFEIVAIVRNPIDIWLSMRYSEKTFYDKELKYLLSFVEDTLERQIPIIKYEDLCSSPKKILDDIYKIIGIETPEEILLSRNVIGDINYPLSSRGAALGSIFSLPRREISDEDSIFLNEHTCAKKISNLLGYTTE